MKVGQVALYGIACILIFSALSMGFHNIPNGRDISSLNSLNGEGVSKSMVYILPYEKCSDYWTETYGDRIYYYVYGNISEDRNFIEKDFSVISGFYDMVILIIPADDGHLYFENMAVMNDIASENGLKIIYAIFPGEKYGREDTYIDNGSKMHSLVIQDMQYLASLNSTYKVAVWYGWTYRCNANDIVHFYNSLSENLRSAYAVWLDEEYAERVRNVYMHGLPHDVLFITEAYDREEIARYSCLYYNQMLVTGYEGANSTTEWRENIERMLSVCKCSNVGIWIFYDIGDGAGENYAAFINGKLCGFNFTHHIPLQKGFSYAAWWNSTFLSDESDESLKNLKSTGTEWVSLVTTWYQKDGHSTEIEPDKDSTPTDESIIHAIDVIHSMGMKVMLKPHVDLYNDEWRGEISFNNEKDWQEWFSSYKNFICHYARLAEENGVEQFSVGCELVKTTEREEWFDVIKDVRENFSGMVTYAADWSNYGNVTFWNALDFIGIDAYFELTDKNDPSMAELLNAWKKWETGIETIHNSTGKKIVFTEIGYRSIDGCNRDPWNWQRHGIIDLQEQADCYEAAFSTFWDKEWFKGFYWWMWEPDPDIGGPNDDGYTPYGKPAESVLKSYYMNTSIYVKIEKPADGYIYLFDREIMPARLTIIIGGITIVANASHNVEKVEFYVDNKLKYTDDTSPHKWTWNEFSFGRHEIKVVAYGGAEKAEDAMSVMKIL